MDVNLPLFPDPEAERKPDVKPHLRNHRTATPCFRIHIAANPTEGPNQSMCKQALIRLHHFYWIRGIRG